MKQILFFTAICAFIIGCKKTTQPVNYGVYGLQTINILNDGFSVVSLPLTVKYDGDAGERHELITLSVSGLPEGITMDTAWQHIGYPPYETRLMLFDTTGARAFPGTYTLTLTSESSISGRRDMTFDLTITNPSVCTGNLTGKYYYCYSYFTGTPYTDSVNNDLRIPNRIWFTNFNNTGEKAYADINCYTEYLSVPMQIINGVTYSGGNVCKYANEMSLTITAQSGSKSNTCVITMH